MPLKKLFALVVCLLSFADIHAQKSSAYLTEPAMSPDRKEIVFVSGGDVWTVPANGGTASLLVSHPATESRPQFSPDGKKVAVVARGEVFAASAKDGGEGQRLTNTAAAESFAGWSPDSRKVIYTSERNGKLQIFQYDFASESESQITNAGDDFAPVYSPDGKSIAFVRNARSLWIYDVNSKQERELCKLYTDAPPIGGKNFVWSPDSSWIAFSTNAPENRTYTNISVVAAKAGEAKPISFVANSFAGNISWSPDGTFILYSSAQRTEDALLARIDLQLRTPKFREDQFRDLFNQETPQPKTQPPPQISPTPTVTPTPTPTPEAKKDEKKTEIVFENIRRRLSILQTGVNVSEQTISPDGKTVLVLASAENQFNLYTLPLDELATDSSAKQITSTANQKSDAQFSPDSKEVFYLENGRVNIVNLEKAATRPLAVNIDLNTNFAQEKMEIFKQSWRYLRDNFYDEKYHGADWNAVEQTYEPLIAGARNIEETRRLMNLMVGELNASHLGVSGANGFTPTPIGKLGLRFDRSEYERDGRLKITEIITLSPADIVKIIKVGDYLLGVDNVKIDGTKNLDELLENKVGKRVEIEFSSNADGANKKKIVVKPITTNAEKNLLYRQWVESNRVYVEKISGGRLGYVHLPDMSSNSLSQLYVDLDVQNQGREGVVIDIRNNNGGFVNPYVIDVLSRRGYLNMKGRGGWTVPARSTLGQRALERPTILITNQHSLSDAEDLTEGYRSLKLGKVVGEPTAGWIIFTWNANTFDGTTVRLPRYLITGVDGKDMELNPRPVDVPVTRPIGESLTGKDSQLDVAVRELLAQIGR